MITENGITVKFPDKNYFQFADCKAYNRIKSKSVKEMDICWLDIKSDTLWLVELKAFTNPLNAKYENQDISRENTMNYWIDELVNKSIHTLCMLETNRSMTKSWVPVNVKHSTKFNLVYLIKAIEGQEILLSAMNDKIRSRLISFQAIFNVSAIVVISYAQAKKDQILQWIV